MTEQDQQIRAWYHDADAEEDTGGDGRGPLRGSAGFLASMLCPGFVWAHKGYVARAFWVNLLFFSVWVAYLGVWIWWKFYPVAPTLWVFGGWIVLLALNAIDAARAPRVRSVAPSSMFLSAFAFVTWFGLLLGLASYATSNVASGVVMRSASMFPTVLPGDVVLVDRGVYYMSGPRAGDVVLYRAPGENLVRMGRIVGLPGDFITFQDGELIASRFEVGQAAVEGAYAQAFTHATGFDPQVVGARFESLGERVYAVAGTEMSASKESFEGEEWLVEERELFLLNDNRGHIDDSRAFGPIPLRNILGMPLYVLSTRAQDPTLRRVRSGTAMQEARSIDALRREAAHHRALEDHSE